ncbi:MAG TPA: hypothetical protein VF092_07205 [Longimicrobium sp.]
MAKITRRPPKRLVYIQVSAERIVARRVATGEAVEDVPQAAIDHTGVVAAFGRAAEDAAKWRPDLRLVNGFSHPRCVVGDMDVAALTLMWFLDMLVNPRGKRRWRRSRPDVVIHPVGVSDLSGLETWGLQRIAQLAGAGSVRVWLGEEPPYETLIGGVPQGGSWLALPARTQR